MVDVNVGVTRCTDGTVKLETDAGAFQMTPKQARVLSNLLSEAAVEPMTTGEVVKLCITLVAVVVGCILFAVGMASIGN